MKISSQYPLAAQAVPVSSLSDFGELLVTAVTTRNLPIPDVRIRISYTGDPDNIIEEIQTDRLGKSDAVTLPAPPLEYSMEPDSVLSPYADYTLQFSADGYEAAVISGVQLLSSQRSLQTVTLRPVSENEQPDTVVIPPHTLYGDYPPKIAELEVKPVSVSGEIVLDRVVVPEYIVVHDGPPSDMSAADYYVTYKDYIKAVASSEIYATWPYETLIANILAIQSFTLNRVYTEWYRNRNYNFTITSSTAFDQKWSYGRNIYSSIDRAVEDVFTNYLSRPNVRQPILTQYCDGKRVTCPQWMRQWDSMVLGEQGYSAIEILRSFYGSSIYINTAEQVAGIPESYPGYPLSIGSVGAEIRKIQSQLNRISDQYPLIPKISEDGIFGERTKEAVQTFQRTFGLTPDGIVGSRTWYRIQDIYVAVTRIAEM